MQAQAQFTIHSLNDVIASTTAPSSPYKGQLWVNTSYSPPRTFVYNGSAWKEQNGTDTLRSNISTLTTKSNTMQSNLDGLTSTVSLVTTRVETVENDLGVVEENVLDIQTSVTELEQTATSIALRVTTNEENISSLTLSHDSLEARVKTAEGNITTIKADVSGIKTRVSTAEGDISSLEQTASSITTRLSTAEGDISSLEQTTTSLTTRITSSEGKITTLTTDVSGLKTRVSTAEGDISTIEQNVSSITTRITTAEGDITSLETSVSGIRSRVSTAEGKITTLTQTVNSLSADVEDNRGNIASLTLTIDEISSDVADNRGNISSLTQTVSTLSSKVSTNTGNISTLTQSVDAVEVQVETNRGNISSLTTSVNGIATRVSNAEDDISSIEQNVSSITSRVSTAEGNISTVTQKVSSLTTRISTAEGDITTLEQTTTALSASVTAKADKEGGSTASFGWKLTSDGFYLYSNGSTVMSVTSTGLTVSGAITATSGSLANLTITGRLKFGGNNSYYIDPNYNDGSYYISIPGLRVDDASGAVFSGKLSAPSGTIGGFTISTSAIYKTKTSYNSTTAGVYIGTTGIGLGAGTFYVTSAGALTSTSGTIGAWTISSSYIGTTQTGGSFYLSSASDSSTYWIRAHNAASGGGTRTFSVSKTGALYATGATISGTINATSGTFTDVTITGYIYFNEDQEYFMNPNYNNGSWYIYLPNFRVDDTSAYFSGTLQAPSGTIGGFTIASSKIYKTKTSYSSSSSGVYIGTDGIGLGAGTFYVTSAGALTASNVNITGGSIKLGSANGNLYTKVDSSGIQCGGFNWARFTLAYSSLHLYANQWGDDTCINDICVGWFGGYDTGISLYGINATCADEDFYVYATRSTDYYTSVGFYMRARSGVTCKGQFMGTWQTYSAISVTSDENVKNSIEPLSDKYSVMFDNLVPKRFKYNNGSSGRYHTGFIAQQVHDSLIAANLSASEFAGLCISKTDEGEEWSLRYEEFIAMNTMEIQKLKAEIKALKEQLGEKV